MDFTMQQLEDMDELDRLYLFEDIPEEDLKRTLKACRKMNGRLCLR